eukprot:412723_1
MKTVNIMFDSFGKWKNKWDSDVRSKSAAEIAEIIYHLPLTRLVAKIIEHNVNGVKFIRFVENNSQFIKQETGWKLENIYQLNVTLYRHKTFEEKEFVDNMTKMLNPLPDSVKNKIKNTILSFDVETLHFQIKHGMEIHDFSDSVINMIDKLIESNEEYKTTNIDNAYVGDDFVKRVYEVIAGCFIVDDNKSNRDKAWTCQNCHNFNFIKLIGSKRRTNLSTCSLCGINQRDAIILKLKNCDTFVNVNNIMEYDTETEEKRPDIENLIKNAAKHKSFDLKCPHRNDNQPCPSLLRLAKYLIVYKRWLHTVYEKTKGYDDINKTIQIDVEKFIGNEEYQ